MSEGSPFHAVHLLNTSRAVGTLRVMPGLAVMAGPTWNFAASTDPGSYPVPFRTPEGDTLVGWPGFQVGVQVL